MPFTPADLLGAALIAPVYQTAIQILYKSNNEYSTSRLPHRYQRLATRALDLEQRSKPWHEDTPETENRG
jgi:hypothetical protein